jgi:NAD(P)H dehydrogenase (quinone)
MANIAIVIYSMYHHIATLAEEVKQGVEATGNKATIYQVPETLTEDVLAAMHAPEKPSYAIATPETLVQADGIIFGFPTRFGSMPAQLKSFIDSTGGLWANGSLYQKPASAFISTGTGGGKETTVYSLLSTLTHHGMLYVPLGYAAVFSEITDLSIIQGSSPWGAGTVAASDGSRQPTATDLAIAKKQGTEFANVVAKITKAPAKAPASAASTPAKKASAPAAASAPAKKATAPTAASTPAAEPKKKNAIRRFFSKIFS